MLPFTDNWGGCQRMYYLADSLISAGDSVEIICAYEGVFVPELKHDFSIFACDIRGCMIRKEDLYYNSFISEKERNLIDYAGRKRGLIMHIATIIAKGANTFFNESSSNKGIKVYIWVFKNLKNLKEIIKKSCCDDVIISGPPHTLFFLLPKLKKMGVRTILDYRDPWNTWRAGFPISKRIEGKFLNLADEIVCTNKNMKGSLRTDFKITPKKIHVIGNGYSKKNWNCIECSDKSEEDFVISYIGSINLRNFVSYRNCKNMIEAFEKFNNKYKDTKLKFVGINDFDNDLLEKYKKKNVEIKGKVSVDESFRIMEKSDVLMIMHTAEDMSGKYIISAKLYDYIAANKAVIGIGHDYDLHKEIIEKEDIGVFCRNDTCEIKAAYEKLYEKWKAGTLKVCCSNKEVYTREFQNRKYVRLLNGELDA